MAKYLPHFSRLRKPNIIALVTILVVVVIGCVWLTASRAATPFATTEPENGAVSAPAGIQTDTTASNGKSIIFGSSSTVASKGVGMAVPEIVWQSATTQAVWLDDMKALGISWIRIDIDWGTVQPTRTGAYNWTPYDQVVNAAKARNIKTLGIIAYSASWARAPECSTQPTCYPANLADYAAYAKAVAQHFGSNMPAVEIWNEPNIRNFWKPAPDPVKYTSMLKQAYAAIKSVASATTVLTGGTSPACTCGGDVSPVDFVTTMYANGAKGSFDVLGHHPYSNPTLPSDNQAWSAWSQMSQTNPSLRSVMQANGDGNKPLWMTEMGTPTNGPGGIGTCTNLNVASSTDHADDCLQAKVISEHVTIGKSYPWAGVLFIYTYKDRGTDTRDRENFFGVIRADGSRKPSYTSLQNAIKQ